MFTWQKELYSNLKNEESLQHYGVPGMKWGVRKEKYYISAPVSNKYYNAMKKYGSKIGSVSKGGSGASSSSTSSFSSGGSYVPNFSGKTKKVVRATKKSGGSGKKSSQKEKAEKALKEKVKKASKGKSGGSGKGSSGSSKNSTKSEKNENLESVDGETEVDHDFDKKNFSSENKLGNTNFYAFKRDDGCWVISDKDKKWVLPEGIDIDKENFTKKFEDFDKQLKDIIKESGYEYTEEDIDMWYTEAINKITSELKTPQETAYEKIAEVINNLLGETTDEKTPKEYEDKSDETKIDDNVSKTLEELEKKKKQ